MHNWTDYILIICSIGNAGHWQKWPKIKFHLLIVPCLCRAFWAQKQVSSTFTSQNSSFLPNLWYNINQNCTTPKWDQTKSLQSKEATVNLENSLHLVILGPDFNVGIPVSSKKLLILAVFDVFCVFAVLQGPFFRKWA